ncbi:CSEP0250 putative effector protein [Blumeria hordei DH14]|uniref:CSEP0250 putative effector protein n=1 Tax=Blumeria graminis f. sp. hordei (strain DH14) TaxID=546991 RepID=N1JCT1_BLUG1|nr:CSEP0250 putative effector protein [Blumeria hordei DH14]
MRFTSAIVTLLALTTSMFIFSIHARALHIPGVSKTEKKKPKPLRTGYRCDAIDFPEDSGWGNSYRIEGLRKVVKQSCGIAKKRLKMTEKQKLDREKLSFWIQDDPYPMPFPQYEKFGFSKEAQIMPLPRPMQMGEQEGYFLTLLFLAKN